MEVNSFQLIPVEFVQFQPNRRKKFVTAAASGLAFPNIRLKMYYPVLQYRYLHLFYYWLFSNCPKYIISILSILNFHIVGTCTLDLISFMLD